ncbi:MAG: hypothetical protein VYD59_04560 [Bacteroidota bacterium]|nr:hypothetical protein [Bacteroidota bacterium]
MKKKSLLVLLVAFILSCQHEIERPNWDIDLIIPIAHTKMNINNIISDSSISVNEDASGFISLVLQEEFLNVNFDTLIKIDAIADEQTHTLDSASFEDVVISDTATIGETINEIPGLSFLLPDGTTATIPDIPNIAQNDTINIDASEYFETMTLYKGSLIVDIKNNFPTDISNILLKLVNASNQTTIADFSFPLIQSGSNAIDSVFIGGQTIDENIFAILINMDINASNGSVLIDYSDAIITTINISDIGITEATAIFPEQQLTEKLKEHSFDLGEAQITEIGIKEGTVKINVLSTLPNGKMVYNIPSLTKNGIPFTSGDMIVPEATDNELTTFSFDFKGYVLDLTGQEGRLGGDTVNTIYTEAYTFIDYTGTVEEINQSDSFYSFIEFDLTTEYAKGYIGQDTINFGPEIINTDIFNVIESGDIDLKEASMNININNYIGADAIMMINNLSAINGDTEISAMIDGSSYDIQRASLTSNNSIIPTNTQINIDADEIIEIFPNKINTSATFYVNPNGSSSQQDFIYPSQSINGQINLEIPLNLIANNLAIIDTTNMTLPNDEEFEIDKIFLTINNGFPFDAEIKLFLLDENNLIIDTLLQNTSIMSAIIDDNNIVIENSTSSIEIDYTNFENIKKIITHSNFSTASNNEYIKLYSSYNLDVTLSAKINKKVEE